MRTKRALAAVVAAATIGAATPMAVASAAGAPKQPSDEFCAAITDHYKIGFLIALAAAFASGAPEPEQAREEITNTLQLVLSPKLEQVTRTMADEAPTRALGRVLRRHARAYDAGVDALREVGVSDATIELLSQLDENADPDLAINSTGVSNEVIEQAAQEWGDEHADDLDNEQLPGAIAADYADAGGGCGVFPDRLIDCKNVVSKADVRAVIGKIARSEDDGGSCKYETKDLPNEEPDRVAIDVYRSPRAYDILTEAASVQNQNVPGLGDEAVAREGINSFTTSSTCGRTVIVRDGERTVVVGACTREEDVDISDVTHLTERVLAKIADL